MDSQQATAWLSEPRFRPFQDATKGDHDAAVALYVWHADLTAACFGVVQHFEVILRNAIDQTLADGQGQQPLKDTWLMDFDTLQPGGIKQVITAVERLERGADSIGRRNNTRLRGVAMSRKAAEGGSGWASEDVFAGSSAGVA